MRKFCQLQRFTALKGLDIISDEPPTDRSPSNPQFVISNPEYVKILEFCRKTNPKLKSCADWSSDDSKEVLSNHASTVLHLKLQHGSQITAKKPNNIIEYIEDGNPCYGKVVEIFKLESGCDSAIAKVLEHYIVKTNTVVDQLLDKLNVSRVIAHEKYVYVHQSAIIGPVPFRTLPAWSLGCTQPTIILKSMPHFLTYEAECVADNVLMDIDE